MVVVNPQSASSPSRAELVATQLREQIRQGNLVDGDRLPPIEELATSLHVGRVSVRQALRVLESEGLLRVQRGREGGSRVQVPRVVGAGDAIAAVVQSGDVPADHLSEALKEIEPICAGFCARREDRATAVVPYLREAHEALCDAMANDRDAFAPLARRFHEEVVARCGNAAMVLIVGAVEAVCSTRAVSWAKAGASTDDFVLNDTDFLQRGLDDHSLILTFIERGDVEGAAREARRHLQWVPTYAQP